LISVAVAPVSPPGDEGELSGRIGDRLEIGSSHGADGHGGAVLAEHRLEVPPVDDLAITHPPLTFWRHPISTHPIRESTPPTIAPHAERALSSRDAEERPPGTPGISRNTGNAARLPAPDAS
jgi:hypothetical protein